LRIFSKTRVLFNRLTKARLRFGFPPRAEVVILDRVGADEVLEYFGDHSVHIVDLDGKVFNFWVLAKTLAKGRTTQFDYLCEYLRFVRPRICLTLIDTTPHIYRLKNVFPELKTFAIQNGWRGYETYREIISHRDGLSIDHMLCFGSTFQSTYSPIIRGSYHMIGSFRSNKVPIQIDSNSRCIALISTLRPKVDLSTKVASYSGRPLVDYSVIFQRRLLIATYVAQFCRANSLKLLVVGKDFDASRERHLYSETLSPLQVDWEFCPRTDLLSSYQSIDRARIVVSTSSSMGYEALARGLRTAFFMIDPEMTGNWGDKFGWPAPLDERGEIWANYLDHDFVLQTLQRLLDMDDVEWRTIRDHFVPRLISSDPNNLVFQDLIKSYL